MTGELIAVSVICFICIFGLFKKTDIFEAFTQGAKDNAIVAFDIFPSLIFLLTAVGMLKASGAIELISDKLSFLFCSIGFPSECLPLVLIRGISGSGALAVLNDILSDTHPDTFTGRVASVMMGSTETTFYTIAIYFSAIKEKCTGKTVIPAVAADIFGFVFAVIFVRMLF